MKVLNIFSVMFFLSFFCQADESGLAKNHPSCYQAGSFRFLDTVDIHENYIEKINKISIQRHDVADMSESHFSSIVKCGYKIETKLGYEIDTMLLHAKKCFKAIDGVVAMGTQIDKTKYNGIKTEIDGKKKLISHQLNDLFYVWEFGTCTDDSEKYFKDIDTKITKKDLKKNNFSEVIVSNNEVIDKKIKIDFAMYYANPGFLIKTKKCELKDKCKKDELMVTYKKRLSDAILKKDNVVLTTDEF